MFLDKKVKKIVKEAIKEDLGKKDITTFFFIPRSLEKEAVIIAKESGILCGIEIIRYIFSHFAKANFTAYKKDGENFKKGEKIAKLEGKIALILNYERVALNFLSFLSGISTLTKKFVEKIKDTKVKLLDTRKTTPNLRLLEKYAVRIGGGVNHRYNLSEAILIKDNHLKAVNLLERIDFFKKKIRKIKNKHLKIEIEVENFKEFKLICSVEPEVIMLDNFSILEIKKAVYFRNKFYPQIKLEASGGITLKNIKEVAHTGVDFISVGEITHSPPACDFSLEIV